MRKLWYLIGPPAAGKSTLMRFLTRHLAAVEQPSAGVMGIGLYRTPEDCVAWQLGRHSTHPTAGTDGLAFNVIEKVQQAITEAPAPLVLGEGDRLANMRFLVEARDAGAEVHVAYLKVPPELLATRAGLDRREQNAKWVQGRVSKVQALVDDLGARAFMLNIETHQLDGTKHPRDLALELWATPALAALAP